MLIEELIEPSADANIVALRTIAGIRASRAEQGRGDAALPETRISG